MSTATEMDELHRLIGCLRLCMTSLVSSYGDTPATRRILNDAEHILNGIQRLDIDTEELEQTHGPIQAKASGQMVQIPDTHYHNDFWGDVDHEGIGGFRTSSGKSRTRKRR